MAGCEAPKPKEPKATKEPYVAMIRRRKEVAQMRGRMRGRKEVAQMRERMRERKEVGV